MAPASGQPGLGGGAGLPGRPDGPAATGGGGTEGAGAARGAPGASASAGSVPPPGTCSQPRVRPPGLERASAGLGGAGGEEPARRGRCINPFGEGARWGWRGSPGQVGLSRRARSGVVPAPGTVPWHTQVRSSTPHTEVQTRGRQVTPSSQHLPPPHSPPRIFFFRFLCFLFLLSPEVTST